jgi:hypothetical protein
VVLTASIAIMCLYGCRQDKIQLEPTEEATPALQSTVHMADPNASAQLVKGFHALEQNSWRWTMGNFAVVMKAPSGASVNGATLRADIAVPEPVIQQQGTVTLTASINGRQVGSTAYSKAGEYSFTADIPAFALPKEVVTINFDLDKFLHAGTVDARELGVIASSIMLLPK